MRKGYTFAILVLLAVALLPGCMIDFSSFNWDDFKYSYDEQHSFSAETIQAIDVSIYNGAITVVTGDTDTITLEVEERIKARSEEQAEEIADAVSIRGTETGGTLLVEVDYGGDQKLKKRYAVKMLITMPEELATSLRSTNGALSVDGVAANVEAKTTNGSIKAANCWGDVVLRSTNGAIKALNISGSVDAQSTNGSLEIEGTSQVLGRTTNGGIRAEVRGFLDGDIRLSTTNGAISFSLPAGSHFELDASTTNGSISHDFGSGIEMDKRRKNAHGTVGEGGPRVRISTTNGGIKIRKLTKADPVEQAEETEEQ